MAMYNRLRQHLWTAAVAALALATATGCDPSAPTGSASPDSSATETVSPPATATATAAASPGPAMDAAREPGSGKNRARRDPSVFPQRHPLKDPVTTVPEAVTQPVQVVAPAAVTAVLRAAAAAHRDRTGQSVAIRGGDPEALARELIEKPTAHLFVSDDNRWMRNAGRRGRLVSGTKQPVLVRPASADTAAGGSADGPANAGTVYGIAGIRSPDRHPGAEPFYDFLFTPEAAAIFAAHGFRAYDRKAGPDRASAPARKASPAEFQVAVASNFIAPAEALAKRFADETGHKPVLVFGSTGKHYAQIVHGAPYAAFLAADTERPDRLLAEGLAVADTRFVYAVGRLALWSPTPGSVDDGGDLLRQGDFEHLAIANPRLAPYGHAARQVLAGMGLWATLEPRLVRGESIGQTYQFVQSGNAELGFVALSQIRQPDGADEGSAWVVPAGRHDPIEQAAVLLDDNDAARAFLIYLQGDEAKGLIRGYGYDVP